MLHRPLAAVVLGSLLLAVTPGVAQAHAEVIRTEPRNGTTVPRAPAAMVVVFSEPVDLDEARLLDGSGAEIPSSANLAGSRLIIRPSVPVQGSRLTAVWAVTSDDGHTVSGASAIAIGRSLAAGPPMTVQTTPRIPATLSGRRAGPLTLRFAIGAATGEVLWTSSRLPEGVRWSITGRSPSASGVLPFAGTWTMRATLVAKDGHVVVTSGTVEVES